jgi:hypothetical protein
MKSPKLAAASALAWLTFCFAAVPVIAQTGAWTQTTAPSNFWASIACSADGARLVAGAGGQFNLGQIYTSADAGSNWTLTAAPSLHWNSVASSADGTRLVAASYGGGIYTSPDSGNTWTSNAIAAANWTCVASSADGGQLAATRYLSSVQYSLNSGANWRTSSVPGIADLLSVAISADGSTFVAGNNVGRIVVSTNGASTWGRSNYIGASAACLNISANGRSLGAVSFGHSLFSSVNGGLSWRSNSLPPNTSWCAAASSADGTNVTVLGQKSIVYSTTNSGADWVSNNAPALFWTSVASSADGGAVFAASSNGGIWIRRTPPALVLNVTRSNSNLALSWIIPSANFVLQRNTGLITTGWSDVTNTPLLNLSNLTHQVSLPLTPGPTFYRLRML